MHKYIGTKLVMADPMNHGNYNKYRHWQQPADENPNTPGYLIEFLDGVNGNDERHKGYITWLPATEFEKTYQEIAGGMSFGEALEALRLDLKVAREGWNGQGMYIYLVGAGRYPPATPAARRLAAAQPDGLVPYEPYIAMKTTRGTVVPWLATQGDVLGTDWVTIDDSEI